MILLMGIKTSFTKNPTNPITTNPIAVLTATLVNSATQKKRSISKSENSIRKSQIKDGIKKRGGDGLDPIDLTFPIGFVASLNEADAVLGEFPEGIYNRI